MNEERTQAGWRIRIGFALFAASLGWPALLPVMPLLGFSGKAIAMFSGVMLVAAEVMLIAGAAIAGKDGFAFIKSKVFGFFKSFGPPKAVSRARNRVGLVMFVVPLLLGWASPYFGANLLGYHEHALDYAIAGDVLLLASLIVLGGDFWDKLRALFAHGAYAVFPGRSATYGAPL